MSFLVLIGQELAEKWRIAHFYFFSLKRPLLRRWAQSLWWIYRSSLSFVIDLMRNEERSKPAHARRESSFDICIVTHWQATFLLIFSSHLLPNLFFSSSLSLFPYLFHNFIGHVLDSVNSVMSLVDYRLYDVMVRVGFRKERWRSSRLYQRTYIKAGLHHIIREGNVYPTKRLGDHESQKATKVAPTVLRSRGHRHYPTVFYTAC